MTAKSIATWLLAICMTASVQPAMADESTAAAVYGVWLMGEKVAIQTFDCSGMLCARVVWLKAPLDPQGLLKRDILNPDPALRQRQVCGPTIVWNLRPNGPNTWEDGWFYNADDGATYSINMILKSTNEIQGRIYLGTPLVGKTKTLFRVPMGTSTGWC